MPAAELMTEDFGLLQLYAESFQTGGALATYLKSYRAAAKRKAKAEGDTAGTADPPMSPATASTVVMVTASALAAQVYPDSRFGSLHAKQLTGAHFGARRATMYQPRAVVCVRSIFTTRRRASAAPA